MEYGGFFLEIERAMLAEARVFKTIVAAVDETRAPYIDFLTDLPADILAWVSEPSVSQIRPLASCPLGHDSEDGDYVFEFGDANVPIEGRSH